MSSQITAFNQLSPINRLEDIKKFNKSELKTIKHRYPDYEKNQQLFTAFQFHTINQDQTAVLLATLLIHPKLVMSDTEEVMAFASQVKKSAFSFHDLENRLLKYVEQGEPLFSALRKAIEREQFHRYKISRNQEVRSLKDPFVESIHELKLSDEHSNKIINAYAVCIESFNHSAYRTTMMKPKICEPIDEYSTRATPRHHVEVPDSLSHSLTYEALAYRSLINKAQSVAKTENLTTFEKVVMAKCIAEQSLRFFQPAHHLFRALRRTCQMKDYSPDKAFFKEDGVCGNFSSITLNIVRALGLSEDAVLAKHGVHIYLEFRENNQWYHAHPFNSRSHCDIIRFKD